MRYKDDDDRTPLKPGEIGRHRMVLRDSAGGDDRTRVQRAIARAHPVDWLDNVGGRIRDGRGTPGAMHQPGFRIADNFTADAREAAYIAYDQQISEAYKHHDAQPPQGGYHVSTARVGQGCMTANRRPGKLVQSDRPDYLVCEPVDDVETAEDSLRRDGESHQQHMARLYAMRDAADSNAWRTR